MTQSRLYGKYKSDLIYGLSNWSFDLFTFSNFFVWVIITWVIDIGNLLFYRIKIYEKRNGYILIGTIVLDIHIYNALTYTHSYEPVVIYFRNQYIDSK